MSSDNDELSKTWQNIPKLPATPLAHRRRLAPSAGVHVSPFCLGALSIGDQWSRLLGDMNRESSFKLLNAFFDAGGNFIDTANGYQDETSERFIGEWAEERGIRDQLFIATKVCGALVFFFMTRCDYMCHKIIVYVLVHYPLQKTRPIRERWHILCRQLAQIPPFKCRRLSQEATHVVHRSTLCALVGLCHAR